MILPWMLMFGCFFCNFGRRTKQFDCRLCKDVVALSLSKSRRLTGSALGPHLKLHDNDFSKRGQHRSNRKSFFCPTTGQPT